MRHPGGFISAGDLLVYSEPTWLETLGRGAAMIIWGVVVIVLGMLVSVVTSIAAGAAGAVMMVLVMIVGSLLMLVGWWLLSSPDPSGVGEDKYGTARKVIRVALIVGLLSTPLDAIERMVAPEARVVLQILGFLAGLVGVVGLFAQLQYLRKLAMRLPDDKLSGRARFLTFAFGGSYAVFLIMSFIVGMVALRGGPVTAGFGIFGCGAGIFGLAFLVFAIMYLLLIEKMGKRFRAQAAMARQTWAATVDAASGPPPVPGA